MKEIPDFTASENSEENIEKERLAIPITDWAKENNHDTLLRHIASSERTDTNMGIFPENICYDPVNKRMTLTVIPQDDLHQGHSFEGTGIMLGGIPKVFVDVTSGALAFTAMSKKSIPLHMAGSYENSGMIIQNAAPVIIESSFKREPEPEDKELVIITTVTQAGVVCVKTEDVVRILPERGAGMIAKKRENELRTQE